MSWTQAKIKRIGRLVIPLIIALFVVLIWIDPWFFESWEAKTLDFRFWARGEIPTDGRIVIVSIDEKSIQELGRWPWPRDKMAALLTRIASGAPKVIAFDILFSEEEGRPSDFAGTGRSGSRSRAPSLSPGDAQFQSALKGAGNVILPVAFDVPAAYQEKVKRLLGDVPDYLRHFSYGRIKQTGVGKIIPRVQALGALPPLPSFIEEASALGHVYTLPDRDGVLRREILSLEYQGDYYPPLSLQAARAYLGLSEMEMELRPGEGVRLGPIRIPADEGGRMLINYHGKERTFPFYSAADVWGGRLAPDLFKEKIVLVGTSALATYDLKVTPFSNNMPGVEKNANVIDSILSRRFLYRTERMKSVDIGLILVFGYILWRYLPRLRALGGFLLGAALLAAHVVLATFLFIRWGVWIYLFYPVGAIGGAYVGFTTFQFFTEEKKAREIRAMFSSYVTPRVVEEMIKNPELAKLGGSRQEVSILFSDIKGFTSFCERLPPTEVVETLNEYLGAMTDVVFRWEGTLDKFVGDAIMVFWGAPLPQEDHAERAVRCALHMRKRLAELQKGWIAAGKEPLDIGIGVNTGEVVVGNMGAEGKKMDYTVIGDAVNLAARVETLTRKYEVPLIITEYTYNHVKTLVDVKVVETLKAPERRLGHVSIRALDEVKVKGREKSVSLYAVIGIQPKKEERSASEERIEVSG
ncbi:MAG TPA: adenylate/guanylate cyclase domain-containing protein [Candidatus Manganitrophaceae bacterium]|nr:adenylate/guanylate cyclase domain-containing protein [Candidatus Manganitrophaceae bacterium]